MPTNTESLIAGLVDDLAPVRPLRYSIGMGLALGALGMTLVMAGAVFGIRADVIAGQLKAMPLLASGLFLVLGLATTATVIRMSRPRVGNEHGGWLWAAAMTGLLPLVAATIVLGREGADFAAAATRHGIYCLLASGGLSVLTFATLTWWLRRGAPTSPQRAGLLIGIAAGCIGTFAYSFHCAYDDIVHIGLWHSAAVVVCGMIGRLIVPRLIRW